MADKSLLGVIDAVNDAMNTLYPFVAAYRRLLEIKDDLEAHKDH